MSSRLVRHDTQLFGDRDCVAVPEEGHNSLLREIETCEPADLLDRFVDERVAFYSAEAPQLGDRIAREGPRETTQEIVEFGREVKAPAWEFTFELRDGGRSERADERVQSVAETAGA